MNMSLGRLGAITLTASLVFAPLHSSKAQQPSPCAKNSNYQRLAFWVGDWDVVDSLGAHYATERVRPVVDGCAFTAEWAGKAGDKGLSTFAFDKPSGEWRQLYVSNEVFPTGAIVRKSDPSYNGPGLRFIALVDPPAGSLSRSRITIMPMSNGRTMQLFEDSSDGGKTWHTLFKAEHRPLPGSKP